MAQVYGGDEVNALVLDTGGAWTRVGWAGEDAPADTLSTWCAQKQNIERTCQYGDEKVDLVRGAVDIVDPVVDSVVSDWDAVQGLWEYALRIAPHELSESPLLITEQLWNPDANKVKTMQLALETLGVPAMYLAKSAVCSLFASGRGSGLVVDAGAQTCAVTPVVDGLPLYRPSRRSRRAGDFLSGRIAEFLASRDLLIVPRYRIVSKTPVPVGEPAQFTERTVPVDITTSFHDFQVGRVLNEFKESMVQVHDAPPTDTIECGLRTFEFPDGHTMQLERERLELGETLFTTEAASSSPAPEPALAEDGESVTPPLAPFSSDGISKLIVDSIKACDVDVRPNLTNNVVITGGTSLLQGFTERVNQDLIRAFPAHKVRIYAPGNFVERTNSAWLGGSILASLGTFHQLWVSRQEYDEAGAEQLIAKRFK